MDNKRYQEEFSNYLGIMSEALKKNNIKVYEYAKELLDESVDEYKTEKSLMDELNTSNFGRLNHIFEEALPTLLKKNKKAVRDVIKTIKEDKNLIGQFNFYNLIREYSADNVMSADDMLDRIEKVVFENIDRKTIEKSNRKLRMVMLENNIVPLSHINEEYSKLYENGNNILVNKPTMGNVYTIEESRKCVSDFMEKHSEDKPKESVSPEKLIEEFENNLKENLTESEISFVQQITDFKAPIAEKRKEKLFSSLKNDCIKKINEMLENDKDNLEIKGLKSQLESMAYSKDTIVGDVAKLLEIRDILMDD